MGILARREHADAGSAPDLVVVSKTFTTSKRSVRGFMFVRDSGIELRIRSYVADVGVAAAQTVSVEHVGAESGAVLEV